MNKVRIVFQSVLLLLCSIFAALGLYFFWYMVQNNPSMFPYIPLIGFCFQKSLLAGSVCLCSIVVIPLAFSVYVICKKRMLFGLFASAFFCALVCCVIYYMEHLFRTVDDPVIIRKKTIYAANNGDQKAQIFVGECYECGSSGFPLNMEKSFQYYKMAADSGSAEGVYRVAVAYKYGQGVEQSFDDAKTYYSQCTYMRFNGCALGLADLYQGKKDKSRNDNLLTGTTYKLAAASGSHQGSGKFLDWSGKNDEKTVDQAHKLSLRLMGYIEDLRWDEFYYLYSGGRDPWE